MTRRIINVGASLDSGDGDDIRSAFVKSNDNFVELYALCSVPPVPLVTSVAGRTGNVVLTVADISGAVKTSDIDGIVTAKVTTALTAALSPIIGTVPATLNSLQKLAAALNNDPAFSATVTANLAGKLSLTGGVMSGTIFFPASYQPTVANAVATKGYVDSVTVAATPATNAKLGTVKIGANLSITSAGVLSADVGTLQLTTMQTTLQSAINLKANQATTYSKVEVDALFQAASTDVDLIASVNAIIDLLNTKANVTNVYNKTNVDALLATKLNISDYDGSGGSTGGTLNAGLQIALGHKADKINTYTKAEVDAMFAAASTDVDLTAAIVAIQNQLALKADKVGVYDRATVDSLLASKATTTELHTLQTTVTSTLATKSDKVVTYTKTEVDDLLVTKADESELIASVNALIDLFFSITSTDGTIEVSRIRTYTFPESLEWIVTHNMATVNFNESMMDSDGNKFYAPVTVVDHNVFIVHLSEATAGSITVVF